MSVEEPVEETDVLLLDTLEVSDVTESLNLPPRRCSAESPECELRRDDLLAVF